MIEELVLGTKTEMCGEFGYGYILSPRSIQKHWDAGQVVQCVHTKIYSICVYCYCEPHVVDVTGTASLADSAEEIKTGQLNWHSVVLDIHVHQGSSAFFFEIGGLHCLEFYV